MDHTIHYDNFEVASMMIIVAIISLFISSIVIPYFLSTSKIEEGTIVQREDSTTTIIIPDKR